MFSVGRDKRPKRTFDHPYLAGNFAPIQRERPLTKCTYTGTIPRELYGGQYVRNGGNPLANDDLGRDAHWFDGDGMLSGVLFRRSGGKGTEVQPEFVNQYILTDLYMHTKSNRLLQKPMLPSIATLVDPLSSLITIVFTIFRTLLLVLLSHLPSSTKAVKRISVANTAIVYHDGRALATCESGPPMRVQLPSLETVGWFNGRRAESEPSKDSRPGFGDTGLLSFMKEWTTGHPRVDPITKEFITFGATFVPPYVHYSIVPAQSPTKDAPICSEPRLNMPVPGMSGGKMMHDFGVSLQHTVIMDLPLSLDPTNLALNKPVVAYDPSQRSRFGVFPRYDPSAVRWFETNPCCIFHTANCWTTTTAAQTEVLPSKPSFSSLSGLCSAPNTTVHLLAARLTSASVVYSAGAISTPAPIAPIPAAYAEEEQCRLYYLAFDLSSPSSSPSTPSAEFALSTISFEFPTVSPRAAMRSARYIYGCSDTAATFSAALGTTAKIDVLAKLDVQTLIARGRVMLREGTLEPVKGCVDRRSVREILAAQENAEERIQELGYDDGNGNEEGRHEPIQLFRLPEGCYAQECAFVPRELVAEPDTDDNIYNAPAREDDGFLLFYVFDEAQLDAHGEAPDGDRSSCSRSELWILDARDMRTVVTKVLLPQRVPYGLHGEWFTETEIGAQRGLEGVRRVVAEAEAGSEGADNRGVRGLLWAAVRERVLKWVA